ncbi:MAG: tetratricopeptide repeat protein [Clostridiales bacterium]|nr:tetratricopeptide repeat protein [Clostridiales bacterium]
MSILGSLYGFLGYFNHSARNLTKAERFYEKGMKKGMKRANHRLAYGVLLLNKGEFQKARDIFSSVLTDFSQKEKQRTMAKLNLSLAYWKLGELDIAIEMLEEVQLKYSTAKVYGALGYMLIESGDLDRALEYNLEAFDYADDDPVILDNLAQTYYRLNLMDQAKEYFLKAEDIKSDQVDTLYYLGLIYKEEGNIDLAREKLSAALDCDITPMNTITREEIQKIFDSLALN